MAPIDDAAIGGDSRDDLIDNGGLGAKRLLAQGFEVIERRAKRRQHPGTSPAPGDVMSEPGFYSWLEITIEMIAHASTCGTAATVADHGPRSHDHFDAMTGPEDSDFSRRLLDRARRGDLDAFALFVQTHERRVAAIVGRVLDDPRDVAEVTQDTFVQVWRNLDSFRGDAAVSTWLYRIATNAALMRARKRSHRFVNLDDVIGDGALVIDADDAARSVSTERVAAVRAALSRLPADQRAAVVLRDIEGFSTAEAAAILDIAEPALKTRVHRARMRLRVLLAEH